MYASARTCCACRVPRRPVQIHHIDMNPSHNDESNLVVICAECHDEAHTKRAMSKNLTAKLLIGLKTEWENEVAERSAEAMLPRSNLAQAMWTYINHATVPRIMEGLGLHFDTWLFNQLRNEGAIDPYGSPIFRKPAPSQPLVIVYDYFEWDAARRLHGMYMRAVDEIIESASPIELGAIWSKREFREMIRPGELCFALRGFRFKGGDRVSAVEDRLVYGRSRGIEIRMHASTRHMYGSSALYTNFCGSSFAAVLMSAKHFSTEKGLLVLHATPIAMGAGFVPSEYRTPRPLKYGWASAP